MNGAIQEGAKIANTFMDLLKREPLSLALVFMNLALLAFFYVILNRVADQRKEEIALLYADKKDVRDLLAKCVVPGALAPRSSIGWPPAPIASSPMFHDDANPPQP